MKWFLLRHLYVTKNVGWEPLLSFVYTHDSLNKSDLSLMLYELKHGISQTRRIKLEALCVFQSLSIEDGCLSV